MYGRLLRCCPSTSYATVICRQSNYVISPNNKQQYTTSSKLEHYDRKRIPSSIGFHQSTGCAHQLLAGAFALRSDTCSRRHLSMQPSAQWILDRLIGGAGGNTVSATLGSSEAQTASSSSNEMADTLDDIGLIPDVPALPAPAEVADLIQTSIADLGPTSYWPSGIVQWILTHAHVDLDLPWWQAIALMMVVVRTVIIPVNVAMRRHVHHTQKYQPKIQELQAQIFQAQKSKSQFARYEADLAQKQMTDLLTRSQIWKPPLLMMCQGFVMITCFTALRGFCASGDVLGFNTGGLWWFEDLTGNGNGWYNGWSQWFLPTTNMCTVFLALKTGLETGGQAQDNVLKTMTYVFPIIAFGAASHFPAAIGYYWVLSNIYTLGLSTVFRLKGVQKALKLPPPATAAERTKAKKAIENMMSSIKR